ncbi:class I SAM-dependent methyltransferase, partial [Arcanobacterium canis]
LLFLLTNTEKEKKGQKRGEHGGHTHTPKQKYRSAELNPYELNSIDGRLYADVRPGYTDFIVDTLVRDFPRDSHIVDMGAGTGKLTLALLERGFYVTAVDPSVDMVKQLRSMTGDHPMLTVQQAKAESTGILSHSIDCVVFSQSWHWMNKQAALNESFRILKRGGRFATVFNQLDVSFAWVKRLTRIMRSGDIQRLTKPPQLGRRFSHPMLTIDSWCQVLSPQQLRELGTTRASWLKSSDEYRRHMRRNLDSYLEEMGYGDTHRIELPYISILWDATRL